MADENEKEIEVTVSDEEPKSAAGTEAGTTGDGADAGAGAGAGTTGDGAKPASGDLDSGVSELQRKLDESERRRIAAEQERDAAFQRAGNAETTAQNSQLAIVLGALETIDANLTTLETQHEEALAAGDFKRATQAARQMAAQEAQKVELQRGKAALEAQARQPAARHPAQLDDNGKVELYVQNMQPRAAAWIRAHPDYVTDQTKNTKLLARHWAAKEAGHVEGSDDYFRFIETGLGIGSGGTTTTTTTTTATTGTAAANGSTDDPLSAAAAPAQRRDVQPPAAAPSRGGGGTRTVRLTPLQQEAARMSGLTNEEYAKNMVREQQAGNIGKTRVH